jgi:hypothetical protein
LIFDAVLWNVADWNDKSKQNKILTESIRKPANVYEDYWDNMTIFSQDGGVGSFHSGSPQ